MRQCAGFLSLLFIAQAQTDTQALLNRAHKDAFRDRPKAEKLVREVLSAWDASQSPKGPEYADAEVFLSLLMLGNHTHGQGEVQAVVQPLVESAVEIYGHATPPIVGPQLALALEIESIILKLGKQEDRAKPSSERAKQIRVELIQAAQSQPAAPTDSTVVRKIGGGVSPPSVVSKVEPQYCDEARTAKYQGTVVLSVVVEPNGVASQIRLLRSLGFGLDEKAVEAVRKWRFKPGMKDGEPVSVYATIEVNFRLL